MLVIVVVVCYVVCHETIAAWYGVGVECSSPIVVCTKNEDQNHGVKQGKGANGEPKAVCFPLARYNFHGLTALQ